MNTGYFTVSVFEFMVLLVVGKAASGWFYFYDISGVFIFINKLDERYPVSGARVSYALLQVPVAVYWQENGKHMGAVGSAM